MSREREGDSSSSCPPCPANPVDIVLGALRQVKVDDVGDGWDIDPPGSHIGGNENFEIAAAELGDGPSPLPLVHIAVERSSPVPLGAEPVGQLIGLMLCRCKDDHLTHGPFSEQMAEETVFVIEIVDRMDLLFDIALFDLAGLNRDFERIFQEALRELEDVAFQSRRKEERLTRLRSEGGNVLNGLYESHIEHPVGFIEDERLDARELDAVALEVVDQSSRGRYQNVVGARELPVLRRIGHAPIDANGLHLWQVLAVFRRFFSHLHGQFARGHQDQDPRPSSWRWSGQSMERGEDKGARFSGSRLRRRLQVMPF